MDDFTLQQELEALAGNAFDPSSDDEENNKEPMSVTINRWQKLFGLSQGDAVDRIMDHRNNLTRTRISVAHWDIVRSEKAAEGYDREAYEYELELQKKRAVLPGLLPAQDGVDSNITFLVELTGPLSSVEKIQHAAALQQPPTVVDGYSAEDGRDVTLCCVDGEAKASILRWASTEGTGFEPTILVDPRSLQR